MVSLDHVTFLAKRRLVGIQVPTSPHFEHAAATEWFVRALEGSTRYLEYGSGGSTYLAAKLGIPFCAIDSDSRFLRTVEAKIREDGFARPAEQVYHHADIGMTGMWGRPVGSHDSEERQEQYRRYSDPPSGWIAGGRYPDLVLIDGRFRVACALKTLRLLNGRTGWTIVIDDYAQRPDYVVLTEFADIDELICDRIAVIRSARQVDVESLNCAIARYEAMLD